MLSCGISKHLWWLLPMYNFFSIRDLNYSRNLEILEMYNIIFKSSRPEMFCKKDALKNLAKFTGKHLCQSLFFKKETLAQVFFCEFCEIFKNTFFTEYLWATASVVLRESLNTWELPSSQASIPKWPFEYLEDDCKHNLAYFLNFLWRRWKK